MPDYIEQHIDRESPLLHELYRYSNLHFISGQMVSGHLQGRVLSMLSRMIHPSRILEIGTFTGYATLCLAEGLTADGRIDTLEMNDEVAAIAQRFFDRSPLKNQIHAYVGNAHDIIPTLTESYELIFLDAEKDGYEAYYHALYPLMPIGGYLLVDNVLWYHKIEDDTPEFRRDPSAKAIRSFNDLIASDERVSKVILPIRDGLTLIQKLR